ncbi:unnamed protein product [Didymodactylos carnosus]|uniref:Uncharacterized protein n=1 Tax=Didymodactylos carnosus TaxID=1234261 RepID=A0A8S2TNN1_9BILA|nr:unnamed protein product [Didymodactylos carnosus]CAF4299586.1 unnamed protein product [Didymodactylos carnosus]
MNQRNVQPIIHNIGQGKYMITTDAEISTTGVATCLALVIFFQRPSDAENCYTLIAHYNSEYLPTPVNDENFTATEHTQYWIDQACKFVQGARGLLEKDGEAVINNIVLIGGASRDGYSTASGRAFENIKYNLTSVGAAIKDFVDKVTFALFCPFLEPAWIDGAEFAADAAVLVQRQLTSDYISIFTNTGYPGYPIPYARKKLRLCVQV